jgi:hypothetical protein
LGEPDGQDNSLLEGSFGLFQSCYVTPLHIGLFLYNGGIEGLLEFVFLGVFFLVMLGIPTQIRTNIRNNSNGKDRIYGG